MKRRRSLTASAAALVVATGLLLAISGPSSAEQATAASAAIAADQLVTDGPHLMSGTLLDAVGNGVGNVALIARVEKNFADGTRGTPVARAVSRPDGTFTLRGALGDAPATVNPDGSVSLEIMAIEGTSVRFFNLNAMPPAPDHADWTFNETPDIGMLPVQVQGHVSELADQTITGLELQMDGDGSVTPASTEGNVPEAGEIYDPAAGVLDNPTALIDDTAVEPVNNAVTAAAYQCTDGTIWYNGPEANDIFRRIPLHMSETRARTLNRFDWSTTKLSQAQVAYNGKSEGSPYKGGLSYSMQNDSSTGIVAKALDEAWRRNILKMGWNFRQQWLWCDNTPGNFGTPSDTGERRYKPHHWTTDNVNVETSKSFTCMSDMDKAEIQNTVWVSKNTSFRWNGYYSIYGLELSAMQGRNTDHKITYEIRPAYNKAWLCGKGDDPAEASWVREYGG